MTTKILQGDCRDILPSLPSGSVHCVVTSPPYYALRSYLDASHPDKHREIGLEPTPDAYIATMVAVFREVRRVLRDDGTVWLNLGSSYASGASRPSRFQADAPACDSDGTEPLGSQSPDCACPGRDDECLDGSLSHHDRSADIVQLLPPEPQPDAMTGHDSGPPASTGATPSLFDALVSTIPSSSANVQDASGLEVLASVVQPAQQTDVADVPASAHMTQSTDGIASPRATSAVRTKDKALSSKACDCGSCGICFAYSTMKCLRFKAKDLMMMPALLALALQADGWYVRSDVIWSKPNPMPESTTDRPTSAHEHVFLLTKAPRYYYDADAVREEVTGNAHPQGNGWGIKADEPRSGNRANYSAKAAMHNATAADLPTSRNLRNVWTIATAPFPEAHFATFPPELAERCIRAGTSERGCCAACGAPWVRVTERIDTGRRQKMADGWDTGDGAHGTVHRLGRERGESGVPVMASTTTGWAPGCGCKVLSGVNGASRGEVGTVPCVVLDPFAGAGTTGLVADRLQRDAVMIELSPAYCAMLRNRIVADAPLLAEVAD